jgi:hypothetical protein
MASWLWWLVGAGVIVYETRKSKTSSASSSTKTAPAPSGNPMAQDLIGTLEQEVQQASPPLSITASSGPGEKNPADWPSDDSYGSNAYRIEGKIASSVGPTGMVFGATTGAVTSYSMWQWVPASS